MMNLHPASRAGVRPLVGFFGKSGSGKTLSALFFARGLAGPQGKVGLIDTENGRGSIFADIVPGGYDVLDLDPPFSPSRYAEAIETVEKTAAVIVIDSLTHEHCGEGGVLDMQEAELNRMAGDNWQKRESCKMASWIKPKMEHKKMVMRLLRSPLPVICCLRAEEKTHMVKDGGKTKVVTDEFSTPIFDHRFIFEMLVTFETLNVNGKGGFVRIWKTTHPAIEALLPKSDEQLSVGHGEAIAQWCAAPAMRASAPVKSAKAAGTATAPAPDMVRPLKEKLWSLCKSAGLTTVSQIEKFLLHKQILLPGETLKELEFGRWGEVLEKTEITLKGD